MCLSTQSSLLHPAPRSRQVPGRRGSGEGWGGEAGPSQWEWHRSAIESQQKSLSVPLSEAAHLVPAYNRAIESATAERGQGDELSPSFPSVGWFGA